LHVRNMEIQRGKTGSIFINLLYLSINLHF